MDGAGLVATVNHAVGAPRIPTGVPVPFPFGRLKQLLKRVGLAEEKEEVYRPPSPVIKPQMGMGAGFNQLGSKHKG